MAAAAQMIEALFVHFEADKMSAHPAYVEVDTRYRHTLSIKGYTEVMQVINTHAGSKAWRLQDFVIFQTQADADFLPPLSCLSSGHICFQRFS